MRGSGFLKHMVRNIVGMRASAVARLHDPFRSVGTCAGVVLGGLDYDKDRVSGVFIRAAETVP